MKLSDLVIRVDELIQMGQSTLATRHDGGFGESLDSGAIKGFRAASLSFIERVYKSSHPLYKEFDTNTDDYYPSNAENGIAILKAIKSEIEGGWLFTMKSLITAEIFSDFLEMTGHLLEQGYKDPAAVMAGSVLEENLRQLCLKNDIPIELEKDGNLIPKKADRLNADLAKNEIYSKLDQKMITTWLDLRNKAAHGQYDQYNLDQVKHMLQSITEFLARMSI